MFFGINYQFSRNIKNLKFKSAVRGSLSEETVAVIQKMARDFPGDIGCFVPLLLNHIVLSPGECCYYAAQELHAYLSGGLFPYQ